MSKTINSKDKIDKSNSNFTVFVFIILILLALISILRINSLFPITTDNNKVKTSYNNTSYISPTDIFNKPQFIKHYFSKSSPILDASLNSNLD